MAFSERLDRWAAGWRGPLLAALLALAAALPQLLALPPVDRDEARFAEASAQMVESGDWITMRFEDAPRFKKPVGIYWLQAATAATFAKSDLRHIWPYRVPSLLGAMLAAAACAWGAAAFLRPAQALAAGVATAAGQLVAIEGALATADAVLCGLVTLMMAALARIYLGRFSRPGERRALKAVFWAALAIAILIKGPIAPLIAGSALLVVAFWDRGAPWLKDLGWGWGLTLIIAVNGPWAMAITVATDGAFWGGAIGQDLAAKLASGQEGHGAPPGFYLLFAPLLLFPATCLLPAGLSAAVRAAREPAMRLAWGWLAPAWLLFETTPTKLVHYVLPLLPALAWMVGRALTAPLPRWTLWAGALLGFVVSLALAAAGPAAALRLGEPGALPWATAAAILFAFAGLAGAVLMLRARPGAAFAFAMLAAVAGHILVMAGVASSLRDLWLAPRAAAALTRAGWSPRQGAPGPVAVAGYAEPSLVFLLGADTELGSADDAARAIGEGRPAIVEGREDAAFRASLAAQGLVAQRAGDGRGLDYSNGRSDILRIYTPVAGGP